MKKGFIGILAVLIFASGVLFVSVEKMTVYAKTGLAVISQISPTPTLVPKIDYYLVYPGVLPDQPIYKIKAVRDRIWLLLTTDPLKKSELLLLYADKRAGAGKVLIEGNKIDLGITTFWKGEKYLEQAVKEIEQAKEKKLNISAMVEKIRKASLKHEEILLEIKEKISPDGKASIEEILKYLEEIQKETLGL